MKLADLERYFAAAATSTSGPLPDVHEVFKDSSRLSASALLSIYNRGYHYRLLGTLASVFVRTKRALGEAEFDAIGLRYLARHPSEHPAIERVGRFFSEYLRELGTIRDGIVDLSALEWARLSALVAPNPEEIAEAGGIDPNTFPNASLRFVPSLCVLSLRAEALTLFAEKSAEAEASNVQGVAVWRKRDVVRHEALDAVELAALELALAGETVSHFCATFASGAEAEDTARAFRVVSGWFSREWIARSVSAL